MTPTTIRTLDELADTLRDSPQGNLWDCDEITAYAEQHGLPLAHGEIDWTSLPTFGGVEPHSTEGVWSWDATRLLVGTCADDIRIIPRGVALTHTWRCRYCGDVLPDPDKSCEKPGCMQAFADSMLRIRGVDA